MCKQLTGFHPASHSFHYFTIFLEAFAYIRSGQLGYFLFWFMRKLFSYSNCGIFVTKPPVYYCFTTPTDQIFTCPIRNVHNKTVSEIVQKFYREWVLLSNDLHCTCKLCCAKKNFQGLQPIISKFQALYISSTWYSVG